MLTQRQISCFENNKQFGYEVAAVLLKLAATMTTQSLVVANTATSTAVERVFAEKRAAIASQILSEQGITFQTAGLPSVAPNAVGGSKAMAYLVRQMLMMPSWDMTPDEWATSETTAVAEIATRMAELLTELTAIPEV